jgi:hypothetical protein
MLMYEYIGMPLCQQKIIPGNTATVLSDNCYNYQEWDINFTSGGTVTPAVGDWIYWTITTIGRACIVSVTLTGVGTWGAGTAEGTFRVKSLHGVALADSTAIYFKTADNATSSGIPRPVMAGYDYKGMQAKSALVCIYTNPALVNICGGTPDQTSLIGIPMVANSSILLKDIGAIKNFKCIDYTASSASNVQVTFFF